MKKSWHTSQDGKPTETADSLFYTSPQQATSTKAAPDIQAEEEKKTRKRTNYKKRYDDLKKHYDGRISQFKQREQELLAENRVSQPEYKAPKTSEDLQKLFLERPSPQEIINDSLGNPIFDWMQRGITNSMKTKELYLKCLWI